MRSRLLALLAMLILLGVACAAHADYIVSGIPYSTLSDPIRRKILRESREVLSPQGALLVYQFTGTVLPYLQSSFGSVQQDFQLLNILPARIFYCTP